ncbi:MAG: hypothetical protein EHM58_08810 [Ignavibacteriae bacterium]|nr:MAG: hypothetical protein EHM58_08810 [Ignavibacteriota bacterium]
MNLKYFPLFIFFLIPLSVFSQSKSLNFDLKYEVTSNDFLLVADTADHKMGKAEGIGSVIFNDGTQGTVKVYFIYDYVKGNGDFIEYYDITLSDGSLLTIQAKGQSIGASSDGTAPLFTGTVTITGGNGKYEGVYGTGSVSGNRNESLISGAKVKLSFNITTR